MPSERRNSAAPGATYSPHTFRRGNAAFSASATLRPARARSKAAEAPAGPPPMTRTSNTAGHEQVAEGRRRLLGQRPARRGRPQVGELATGEAGAHADHRIVAGHVVGADEPHQAGAGKRE